MTEENKFQSCLPGQVTRSTPQLEDVDLAYQVQNAGHQDSLNTDISRTDSTHNDSLKPDMAQLDHVRPLDSIDTGISQLLHTGLTDCVRTDSSQLDPTYHSESVKTEHSLLDPMGHKDSLQKNIGISSASCHELLRERFEKERDAVIEQLRTSLDVLFLCQIQEEQSSAEIHPALSLAHLTEISTVPKDQPRDTVPNKPQCHSAMAMMKAEANFGKLPEVTTTNTAVPWPVQKRNTTSLSIQVASPKAMPAVRGSILSNTGHLAVTGMSSVKSSKEMIPGVLHCTPGVTNLRSTRSSEMRGASCQFNEMRSQRFSDLERSRQEFSTESFRRDYTIVEEKLNEVKEGLADFVKSSKFETLVAILLLSNIALLGIQVEIQANSLTENDLPAFKAINVVYCIAFFLELVLRFYAHGRSYLWGHGFMWNWLDLAIVMMQIGEITIAFTTSLDTGSTFSFFARLVRIARVARAVRVIRIMRFLRGFKVLVDAICATLLQCIWALILCLIIIYVFSLIFAQFASDFLAGQAALQSQHDLVAFYFGNFTSSMFTLVKAIIGGVDWEICVIELSKIGDGLVVIFIMYVTLMQFVVINVIAGLFLHCAIEQAQQDQDHIVQLRLKERQHYVEKLKALFMELDSSHDGLVSLPEFESHLKTDKVQAFFAGLEIENADAWTIFKLLDTDGGGAVDYTKFVDGCIRLKGNAKSIEMAQLMYHHKWIMDKVCELSDFLYAALDPGSGEESQAEPNATPMLS